MDWSWLEPCPERVSKREAEVAEIKKAAQQVMSKSMTHTILELIERLGAYEKWKEVPEDICPQEKVHNCGALANLENKPGPTNCSEPQQFQRCLKVLFKNTETFSRNGPEFMEGVFEFQLWLLQKQWKTLRKEQHKSTKNTDMDQYCWNVLKQVHRVKLDKDRDRVALNMVGDYKRLSVNPRALGFCEDEGGQKKGAREAY